jgi:two-component system chemotaxis sensor kinase CheA
MVVSGPRRKLLYVDDDAALRRLAASFLGDEFDVVTEPSAETALARIDAGENFDVIVTDLDLPGKSGQELFAALRRHHADQARRVAFTSSADAMPGGGSVPPSIAVRYLRKPFDREGLLTLVRKVLRVVDGRPTWTGV